MDDHTQTSSSDSMNELSGMAKDISWSAKSTVSSNVTGYIISPGYETRNGNVLAFVDSRPAENGGVSVLIKDASCVNHTNVNKGIPEVASDTVSEREMFDMFMKIQMILKSFMNRKASSGRNPEYISRHNKTSKMPQTLNKLFGGSDNYSDISSSENDYESDSDSDTQSNIDTEPTQEVPPRINMLNSMIEFNEKTEKSGLKIDANLADLVNKGFRQTNRK